MVATTYAPVFSGNAAGVKFRGQDVSTGWLARQTASPPPCPPGTEFCIRECVCFTFL